MMASQAQYTQKAGGGDFEVLMNPVWYTDSFSHLDQAKRLRTEAKMHTRDSRPRGIGPHCAARGYNGYLI